VDLSDGGVALLEALPFAPGSSPFRVKGTAFRGHLDFVARKVPGGVDDMLARMQARPGMRAFYEQTFLASSLYDVFPLAWGGVVGGAMMGMSYLDFVRLRTSEQARSDVGGVYRVLLALTSPNAVAQRLPKLLGQYFDFGATEIEVNEPGRVVAKRTGIPAAIVPWYEKVTEGYCDVVITRAGAKEVRVESQRASAGTAHGMPMMDMRVEIAFG
jgi:hypothetical protein